MRIAILGAGIVGVTTAHELAADGHEVTVFERRGSVAAEASFAGAGIVAPALVAAWSAPGHDLKLRHALTRRAGAMRLQPARRLAELPWLWRCWRAGRGALRDANRGALWRLASFSRERLLALTQQFGLDHEQSAGVMVLLRGERDLAQARPALKLMAELGASFELLDADRARAVEPGLNPATALRAAIRLPHDGVGNARQFAQLLKAQAQRHGAQWRFDTEVRSVQPGAQPQVVSAAGSEGFDAVVLCTGADSNRLLAPLGLRLPLLAVHGYSITAPLRHHDGHPDPGPVAALVDASCQVALTRLGQRVRVAGGAELGGRPERFDDRVVASLYRVLDDWFPGAAMLQKAQRWKGARPTLPDGPPVLGASGAAGVWLNLGHGHNGWALSCGSARVLAELIGGRAAPLDLAQLGIERLRR